MKMYAVMIDGRVGEIDPVSVQDIDIAIDGVEETYSLGSVEAIVRDDFSCSDIRAKIKKSRKEELKKKIDEMESKLAELKLQHSKLDVF